MPKCSVSKCGKDADYEVILYDIYAPDGEVFLSKTKPAPSSAPNTL